MATEIKEIDGKIILFAKNVNRMIERKVIKNNSTSGKITVPTPLINKKVYVVWFEEEK